MGRSMRVRKEVDYSDPGELSLAEIRRGAPNSASRADQSHSNSTDSHKSKTKNSESPVQGSPKLRLKDRPKAKASAEMITQNLGKESDKKRSSVTAGKSLIKAGRKTSEAPPGDGSASAPKDATLTKPDRSERVTKTTPPSNRAVPAKRLSPTKPSTPTKRTSLAKSSIPLTKVASAPSKMALAATKSAVSRQPGTGSTTGKRTTDTQGDRIERESIKRPRGRSSASFGEVVVGGTGARKGKENTAFESGGKARKEAKGSKTCDNKGEDDDNKDNSKATDGARKADLPSSRGSKSPPKSKASAPRPLEPVGDTSAFDLPDASGEEDEPESRPPKPRIVSMPDNEDDTPTPPQFPRRQARVSPRKTPAAPRGRDGKDDVPSPAPTTENRRDMSGEKAGDRRKSTPSDPNPHSCFKLAHVSLQPPPISTTNSARSSSKLVNVSRRSVDGVSTVADRARKSDGETTVTSGRNTPSKRQRTVVTQAPSTPDLGVSAIAPRVLPPIPPPGTPAVTQAQEQFLSELRVLLGSIGDVASSGNDSAEASNGSSSTGSSADPRGSVGGYQRDEEKKKLSEEVEYWKGRFEELSSLRETVPEMQLELFREHASMREQAAQELIDHLRKQVSDSRGTGAAVPGTTAKNASSTPDSCLVPPPPTLPSQTPGRRARLPEPALTEDELEADHPLSSPRSSAYVRSLEDKLEYHRKVIRLYQNLSSLAIQVQPEPRRTRGEGGGRAEDGDGDGEVMTCTAVNHLHRRAVRFDLRVPGDEDVEDFMYRATGNRHLLPEYMQHELSFTKKQCPLFLTKLLQNLFRS